MNPVLQYSNEEDVKILNTVCSPVTIEELSIEDFDTYQGNMLAICAQYNGVGLSANQIGITKRFFVINTPSMTRMIINPEIVDYSGVNMSNEGCLSFADGTKKTVRRYEKLTVSYLDYKTKEIVTEKLSGLNAIVFQHELDHLNGITI